MKKIEEKQPKENNKIETDIKVKSEEKSINAINKKTVAYVLLGLAGLIVGCRLLVYSADELGSIFAIPEMIMGLFRPGCWYQYTGTGGDSYCSHERTS